MHPQPSCEGFVEECLRESLRTKEALFSVIPALNQAATMLANAYLNGGKAIFFGNGGSASDAQHLAAELVGRFRVERRPLAALALHENGSTVTAIANDYGYDEVFARQLEAHARPGDVAVAISTSGRSRNVVRAAMKKESLGVRLIAFTGEHTETLAPFSDVVLPVRSTQTARIQECHILFGHILCEWVERVVAENP